MPSMMPRLELRKPSSCAMIAALVLSLGAYSISTTAQGADNGARPATFFRIAAAAMPAAKEAPPVGTEPFGLFAFRAPDGMLWRKWRGLEADIARDQIVL